MESDIILLEDPTDLGLQIVRAGLSLLRVRTCISKRNPAFIVLNEILNEVYKWVFF